MQAPGSPIDGERIRRTVLEVVSGHPVTSPLQAATVLSESVRRLRADGGFAGLQQEQALLTFFGDLFRIGYLAWGYNVSNPGPPFCHITERGRGALAKLSRDPSNPDGYLAHLRSVAPMPAVTESYVREALSTYSAGCFKAAAVMIGVAAESVVLELRDAVGARLDALGRPRPKALDDWRVKTVLDALEGLLSGQKTNMPKSLFEEFEAYWSAFTQQIRVSRNSAGHPASLDPLQEQTAHASLLIFPELFKLAHGLVTWVRTNLS